jgi:hypothetical protein
MGSQQQLLIIVGVLMVGLSIAIGITLFTDSAAASNRDAIASDLETQASRAQIYQKRPKSLGGGGGSFVGFRISNGTLTNHNGTYSVTSATATSVVIQGIGHEIGYDQSTSVKVAMTVSADTISVAELN